MQKPGHSEMLIFHYTGNGDWRQQRLARTVSFMPNPIRSDTPKRRTIQKAISAIALLLIGAAIALWIVYACIASHFCG